MIMQICEAKNCWLADSDNIPASELPYWVAYYDLQSKKHKRDAKRAEHQARMNAKR